jgi:hypothetical protein
MKTSQLSAFDLISFADAARLRDVSRQSITKLVNKGRFKTFTVAGRKFLSRKEIEDYSPLTAGRPPAGKKKKNILPYPIPEPGLLKVAEDPPRRKSGK